MLLFIPEKYTVSHDFDKTEFAWMCFHLNYEDWEWEREREQEFDTYYGLKNRNHIKAKSSNRLVEYLFILF